MKVNATRILFAILLILFFMQSAIFAGGCVIGPGGGIDVNDWQEVCSSSEYAVAAATNPGSLIGAVLFALLVLFLPRTKSRTEPSTRAGLVRRGIAFFYDWLAAMAVAGPLTAWLFLGLEAAYTGSFRWTVERDVLRASDWLFFGTYLNIYTVLILLLLVGQAWRGRATLGLYLMDCRIVAADDESPARFGLRWLLLYLGLVILPISLVAGWMHPEKKFWWDMLSRTKVVHEPG